jgi:uncharacterized protein YjbJ (UPF0337 family)
MSDSLQGSVRELGGRAQRAFGAATGDAATEASGLYNQAAGMAQRQGTHLAEVIRDQPLLSAAVAIGLGYLIGRLTS